MCILQAFRMDKMSTNVRGDSLRMEWISALFHSRARSFARIPQVRRVCMVYSTPERNGI